MSAEPQKSFKTAYLPTIGISAIAFLLVLVLRQSGLLSGLELLSYDWMVRMRPAVPAGDRVTLLTITENDIQTLGRWPIPNGVLAEALQRLVEQQPRSIGIDVYLDVPVPPGREALEAVLTANPNIIAAIKFAGDKQQGVPPPSVLDGTDQTGFTDMLVDPGGITRRSFLFQHNDTSSDYSLALRVALGYLAVDGIGPMPDSDMPEHLRLGRTTIAPLESNHGSYVNTDAAGYQFMIDYRSEPGTIPTINLLDVLGGEVSRSLINDRAILVGVAAESVKDFFYTPYSTGSGHSRTMPGVEVHGHIVNQLLRYAIDGEGPIRVLTAWQEALWLLLWSTVGGFVGLLVRSPARFALVLMAGLLLTGAGALGAFISGWWIPLVPPAIAWTVAASIVTSYISYRELQERTKLMSLFSRHISHDLAVDIWQHRDQFLAGGHPHPQKLTATTFFSDIAGFTAVSEQLEPRALMDWLSEYMGTMTPIVNEHHGVILRFIGDAIMAVFGLPIPRLTVAEIAEDAHRAVECAITMKDRLIEHNRKLQEEGRPLVTMRVGIYTGPMVAGSIGDAERLEYNVHGDSVNTAARLEGFEKEKWEADPLVDPCRIFIGEPTLTLIGPGYRTELVGEVQLKGKAQFTRIFRVYGHESDRLPVAVPAPVVQLPLALPLSTYTPRTGPVQ